MFVFVLLQRLLFKFVYWTYSCTSPLQLWSNPLLWIIFNDSNINYNFAISLSPPTMFELATKQFIMLQGGKGPIAEERTCRASLRSTLRQFQRVPFCSCYLYPVMWIKLWKETMINDSHDFIWTRVRSNIIIFSAPHKSSPPITSL